MNGGNIDICGNVAYAINIFGGINLKLQKKIFMENQNRQRRGNMKKCKCGCGWDIKPKPHHKWLGTPDFIQGHNGRNRKFSENTIRLLSEQKKGNLNPAKRADVRNKMSKKALLNWSDPEYKAKHSGDNAPMFNKKQKEESKAKISLAMQRIGIDPEYVRKQKEAKLKFWENKENREKVIKSNLIAWQNSERKKKCSENFLKLWKNPDHRKKMSDRMSGEKSPFWKGGGRIYGKEWTKDLKNFIRERDGHSCQLCGINQNNIRNTFLDVHHIDYDKKNCNPDNLISLCRTCHMGTIGNRESWTEFFINLTKQGRAANAY